MEKKVILITGASGGMGNALANLFLKDASYILALHSNKNEIQISESEKISHHHADLSNEEACNELIAEVVQKWGQLDVLINNAGISRSSMSWKTPSDAWRETMAINLDAPFYLSRAVIPFMRQQEVGRIINISSIVAQTGFVGTSAYAASKAGLLGLTKTLSKELAGFGITVNALALGYFNVGMIEDVPEILQEEIITKIPLRKLGSPSTVFKTLLWLISDEGAYVTGQTINLNGGLHS